MALDVTGRVFRWADYDYVSMCVLNNVTTVDMPTQPWSSEMLHWEDYRAQRGINDGTPSLSTLYPRHDGTDVLPKCTLEMGGVKYVSQSIAVRRALMDQPVQTFCSEMQHWDDVLRSRNMYDPNEPLMSTLFEQWNCPEYTYYVPGTGTITKYVACSIALRKSRNDVQTFCSEMQHWDDIQRAKTGVLPQPCMAALFNQY